MPIFTNFVRKFHTPRKGTRNNKTYITADKLRELITKQLGKKLDASFQIYIADEKYYCPPLKDVRQIVKESALDRQTWVEERFDCDDFAITLKANFAQASYKDGQRRHAHCCGVVWGMFDGEAHAINWVVTSDKRLRFIEPQTDEIFRPRKNDREIWFMLV